MSRSFARNGTHCGWNPGVCDPSAPETFMNFSAFEPMRPVGADENPCDARGCVAVLALPFRYDLARQQEVGICGRLGGDIDDARGPDESIDRDIVRRIVRVVLPRYPMNRRVEMRAGVFSARDVVPIPGGTALVVAGNLFERKWLGGGVRRRQLNRRRPALERRREVNHSNAAVDDGCGESSQHLRTVGTCGLHGCVQCDSSREILIDT